MTCVGVKPQIVSKTRCVASQKESYILSRIHLQFHNYRSSTKYVHNRNMSELFLLTLALCLAPPPCAHLVGPAQRGPCWAVAKNS